MQRILIILSLLLISTVLLSQPNTIHFNYTGNSQNWIVPTCVTTITVSVAGASGGGYNGGNGALISGTLTVTAGETLQINVGGAGSCPTAGYNGGGTGATANNTSNGACGGGGATDIRNSFFQLSNRIIVAAGGGGMGGGDTDANGGAGGCNSGELGTSPYGVGGAGGSQTNGGSGGPPWIASGNYGSNGSLAYGGNGATDPCYNVGPGGGGGGGYYGGGGGGSDCYANTPLGGGGGGGGSSLVPTGFSCNQNNNNTDGYVTITYYTSSTSNTTTNVACDSYIWSIDGNTYTSSGTYTDVSTNAAGCTHTETLNLVVGYSDNLNTSIEVTNISCFGYNDGSIILNPNGGVLPYQFLWSNGSANQSITSLSTGSYSFSITDANGCTLDSITTIIQPNQISLNFLATSPICRYDESILSIDISNSTSNIYTMSLQDSVLKSFVIDTNGMLIAEGVPITLTPNYSGEAVIVSLTDNFGCTEIFNDSIYIEVNQLPDVQLNEEDACIGDPSYILNQATPTGGTYFINNEMTDYFDVENLTTEEHIIRYEYTDSITSCYNEVEEVIKINKSPEAFLIFGPQPTDMNDPHIHFIDNSENAVNSIWDLGDSTIIYNESSFWHTYNNAGTYIIKYYITNQFNCTDSIIKNLIINPIYNTYIPLAFTPNNDNDNDYFFPSIIGANNYNMKIYDRWGKIIYNEDNGKWNGKVNNNYIVSGIYSYSITVFDFKDKPFIYTGLVTIIK